MSIDIEKLAGGIKPDFDYGDVDPDSECDSCVEDEPVVYVSRMDPAETICLSCSKRIPEVRLIREYIRIDELPGAPGRDDYGREEVEVTAAQLAKEFAHPETGRVFVVLDGEGDIKAVLNHTQVKPIPPGEFKNRLQDYLTERDLADYTSHQITSVIQNDDGSLTLATLAIEPISTVTVETAENYLEEQDAVR